MNIGAPVVGMDAGNHILQAGAMSVWRCAHQQVAAVRPFQLAGRDIQPPMAHAGDPLRLVQFPLPLAERHFRPFSIRNVHQHVDGADKPPPGIAQGGWIGDEGNPDAVGTFRYGFAAPHRAVLLHCDGHGTLVMGERRAVGHVEPP
jgi:hypothetical protein